MRASFFAGIAALGAGSGAAFVRFLMPPRPDDPNRYRVRASDVPAPGADPLLNKDGGFFIVNVSDEEARLSGRETGGLMAVARVCTHLPGDCPPAWLPDFAYPDPDAAGQIKTGWLRCPCHGSMFGASGRRVFGPASRSLDAFAIDVRSNGDVIVDTSQLIRSGISNPEFHLSR